MDDSNLQYTSSFSLFQTNHSQPQVAKAELFTVVEINATQIVSPKL